MGRKRKRVGRGASYDVYYVETHFSYWTRTLFQAYATDGNARVKRAVSAVCTTFGVGELSALNGIGMSEHLVSLRRNSL